MLDLILAIAHHLLIFALFGILFAEFMMVRRGMEAAVVAKVAAIDLAYGAIAGLILIVGFSRAVFAAKGWTYYSHNLFFWAKIATFAVVGLLSVPPTLAFIRWRRAGTTPSDAEVASVRRYLHIELALFALLPALAAAMARGYGEM
jgi:putative membrane protein